MKKGRWKSAAIGFLSPFLLGSPQANDLQPLNCEIEAPYTAGFVAKYDLHAHINEKDRKLSAYIEFSKNDHAYQIILRPHLGVFKRIIAKYVFGADLTPLDYWQATRGLYDNELSSLGPGRNTVYRNNEIVATIEHMTKPTMPTDLTFGILPQPLYLSQTDATLKKDACLTEGTCSDSTYANLHLYGILPFGPIDGFINILNTKLSDRVNVISPVTKGGAGLDLVQLHRIPTGEDSFAITSLGKPFWGLQQPVHITKSGVQPYGVSLPRSISTGRADIFSNVKLEWSGFGECSPKH